MMLRLYNCILTRGEYHRQLNLGWAKLFDGSTEFLTTPFNPYPSSNHLLPIA